MSYRVLFGACMVLLILMMAVFVKAASPDLQIEYTYPAEAIPNTTEFRLYIELTPGVKTQIAATSQVDATTWETRVDNIPMGKTLNYYMSAIDIDGDEGVSPPFPFKLIGKPTINFIRKLR